MTHEEEIKRMELYRQGLNDTEIAEECGVTREAIRYWRKSRKLRSPNRMPDSLCWDCKNARAHICPWIALGKQIWDRAQKAERSKKIRHRNGTVIDEEYTVYAVEECRHFKPEEKRKVAGW